MLLFGVGKAIYFYEVFQCYAFHQCHNIWMKQFFSGPLPISVVALLNWFTKRSKFEEGLNDNELS